MSGWGDSLTRSKTVNLPACASFGMVGYSPPGAGTCVTDSAGANPPYGRRVRKTRRGFLPGHNS
jgi:hypothetical protein